ncbi:hypothetical protein PsYK624_173260 [Phanerochaete sordida]|uniref:Uncharacterized protein n=1 Tax=Phanerochaete sordida TaxID=48140 RepID=A0A9P3LPI5_9APHY|nr:hypothetical protein PsYK624_173260 [Phanerochaete sordida]
MSSQAESTKWFGHLWVLSDYKLEDLIWRIDDCIEGRDKSDPMPLKDLKEGLADFKHRMREDPSHITKDVLRAMEEALGVFHDRQRELLQITEEYQAVGKSLHELATRASQ